MSAHESGESKCLGRGKGQVRGSHLATLEKITVREERNFANFLFFKTQHLRK
jgi:hypothetical protein